MRKVITPTAIPIPKEPKRNIPIDVARADAETFTRLFPISIVIKRRLGSSSNFDISLLFFVFSLTILCRFILPSERSAISDAEKKADSAIKTKRRTN